MVLAFAGVVAVAGLAFVAASGLGAARVVVGLPVSVAGLGLFALALRASAPVGDGDLSALAVLRIERWALTPPALAALLGAALVMLDPSLRPAARLSVGLGCLMLFVAFGLLVTRARPVDSVGPAADIDGQAAPGSRNARDSAPAAERAAPPDITPRPPTRFTPRGPGRFDAG